MYEKRYDNFSYLEFGSVDPQSGKRTLYDYRTDSQAYEWLMHGRYSNDIYAYYQMIDALKLGRHDKVAEIFSHSVHHPDDCVFNMNKMLALSLAGKQFFELGQTLFGCIEGITFCHELTQRFLPELVIDNLMSDTEWYGVDISTFFNAFAIKMHGEHKVKTATNMADLPASYDVVFAKGITLLYAINGVQALFDFLMKGAITILDYSFNIHEAEHTQIGTGKNVCFLSKAEFAQCYEKILAAGKDICVRGNAGLHADGQRFYFEGIVAEEVLATEFIHKNTLWHNKFKETQPELYEQLVHNKTDKYWCWQRLADVIELI